MDDSQDKRPTTGAEADARNPKRFHIVSAHTNGDAVALILANFDPRGIILDPTGTVDASQIESQRAVYLLGSHDRRIREWLQSAPRDTNEKQDDVNTLVVFNMQKFLELAPDSSDPNSASNPSEGDSVERLPAYRAFDPVTRLYVTGVARANSLQRSGSHHSFGVTAPFVPPFLEFDFLPNLEFSVLMRRAEVMLSEELFDRIAESNVPDSGLRSTISSDLMSKANQGEGAHFCEHIDKDTMTNEVMPLYKNNYDTLDAQGYNVKKRVYTNDEGTPTRNWRRATYSLHVHSGLMDRRDKVPITEGHVIVGDSTWYIMSCYESGNDGLGSILRTELAKYAKTVISTKSVAEDPTRTKQLQDILDPERTQQLNSWTAYIPRPQPDMTDEDAEAYLAGTQNLIRRALHESDQTREVLAADGIHHRDFVVIDYVENAEPCPACCLPEMVETQSSDEDDIMDE